MLRASASAWRVVTAFCVTTLLSVTPMIMLLAERESMASAEVIAEARYGEIALLALLVVVAVATVVVATVVLAAARRLGSIRG